MSASTMRSPSSFRLMRTVPWVAGCDGPIWISSGSPWRSSESARSLLPASVSRTIALLLPLRLRRIEVRAAHQRLPALLRVILAERMPFEFLVEIDAAKIGMTVEPDTVEIPGLAFEPIGPPPHADDAVDARIVFRDARLHAESMPARQRLQVVHDLEARRAAEVVDGGHVGQEVESECRVVAQEAADLDDPRRGDLGRQVS